MGRSNKVNKIAKVLGAGIILFLFCILIAPRVDFDQPYSKAIYDKEGQLLGWQDC